MSQVKYCPRCKSPAELSAPSCIGCGRVFKTQFAPPPDDRTMLGPAGMPPPPASPTVANYSPAAALGGPLDDAERNVSMAWTSIGLFFTVLWTLGQLNAVIRMFFNAYQSYAGYAMLGLLLPAFLISFLTMRLRRLYLSAPGQFSPRETMARRARFSVWSSVGIFALVIVGSGMSLWQVNEEVQKAREVAATAAREKADRERQAEEFRRSVEPPVFLNPDPDPTPTYRPSTSFPTPTYQPSTQRPIRPRVNPNTLVRPQRDTSPPTWDPNTLPCGHRFTRFERSRGHEVGVCDQGHKARIINMRWVPVAGF